MTGWVCLSRTCAEPGPATTAVVRVRRQGIREDSSEVQSSTMLADSLTRVRFGREPDLVLVGWLDSSKGFAQVFDCGVKVLGGSCLNVGWDVGGRR